MSPIRNFYYALKRTWYGVYLARGIKYIYSRDPFHHKLRIENKGSIRFSYKEIIGGGQFIEGG